jgi:hypothetical protein
VLLIAVAGCSLPFDSAQTDTTEQKPVVTEQDPRPTWGISVRISEPNPEPGEQVQVDYGANGYFNGTAYGVTILFLGENKSVIKEVPGENITILGETYTVNTTVPEVPLYVTAKMEGWDTPGMEPIYISGQLYNHNGESQPYEITNKSKFTYNSSTE